MDEVALEENVDDERGIDMMIAAAASPRRSDVRSPRTCRYRLAPFANWATLRARGPRGTAIMVANEILSPARVDAFVATSTNNPAER